MRILIFSPVDLRDGVSSGHNGGGWIGSFVHELQKCPSLSLGICWMGQGTKRMDSSGIAYYPLTFPRGIISRLRRGLFPEYKDSLIRNMMAPVIRDFSPDVIHIFGSENAFGLVCSLTAVPCVIHLQGFLPSCENAEYPPGFTASDFLPSVWRHPLRRLKTLYFNRIFSHNAKREISIFCHCKNFFGRTDWDKNIVSLYAPQARYWYCSEFLRNEFYSAAGSWNKQQHSVFRIVSILSTPTYKGHDLVLKAASLLKNKTDIPFEWHIFGGEKNSVYEKRLNCCYSDCNVIYRGTASAETLVTELQNADVYVHPSYIDNSPNSLCEAQLIGVPCVAVNAGGVSSLVCDSQTGCLVPANDPVMLVAKIRSILLDADFAMNLGRATTLTAVKRHDKKTIVQDALACYQSLAKSK